MKPSEKKINPSHGRQELLTLDRPHPVNGEWLWSSVLNCDTPTESQRDKARQASPGTSRREGRKEGTEEQRKKQLS